ncbi:MAG: hypothetical protein WA230_09720 [Xanthobacteraceae bacterium]|jgi:uncharacterized OB-fold protein
MQTERAFPALPSIDFPGGHSSNRVRPLITQDTEPHYDGLRNGMLVLPECSACKQVGPPVGACCLWCGSGRRQWRRCTGAGVTHSWVRYHRAYLPEFEALIPYAVVAAKLDEGPIMFGRWLSPQNPDIDTPLAGVIERWADGFCGLAFRERRP